MKHLYRNVFCKTFPGFYESHLYNSDTLYYLENVQEGYELDFIEGGYKKYCLDMCEKWVYQMYEWTDNKIDIKSMKFREMSSPREYNFTTDKIYIDVEFNLNKLKKYCFEEHSKDFDDFLHKYFTSCDGFISFVPNSLYKFLKDYKEDNDEDVLLDVMLEYYFLQECDLETVLFRTLDFQGESLFQNLCLYKQDDRTNWDMEWDNDKGMYIPTTQIL